MIDHMTAFEDLHAAAVRFAESYLAPDAYEQRELAARALANTATALVPDTPKLIIECRMLAAAGIEPRHIRDGIGSWLATPIAQADPWAYVRTIAWTRAVADLVALTRARRISDPDDDPATD